jgi:hypothetical protein
MYRLSLHRPLLLLSSDNDQHRTGTLLHPQALDVSPLRIYDFDFTADQKHLVGAASYAREPFLSSHPGGAEVRVGMNGEGGGYREGKGKVVVYEVEGMREISYVFLLLHALYDSNSCPFTHVLSLFFRLASSHSHYRTLNNTFTGEITCFRLSKDGKTAIININPDVRAIYLVPSLPFLSTDLQP